MEKVSADTITRLTAEAAGLEGELPTAAQMIADLRASLTLRVQSLAKSMQQPRENGQTPTAFGISHRQALEDLQKFEKLVATPPNGFRLAPVLYSRIDQSQNHRLYAQFSSTVRPQFMRYLAENHAGELSTLGICQRGIDRMKMGFDPVSTSGRLYNLNVDHIIERFGGGNISTTAEIDPLMPPGSKPTFLVNHINNLVLLPRPVHDLKNDLNELQAAAYTSHGKSKWVLMLVPEAGSTHSGYVAQPQGGNLGLRDGLKKIQIAEESACKLNILLQNPAQEAPLKAALNDTAVNLAAAFNDVSDPRQSLKPFLRIYESEQFKALRQKVESLPADQGDALSKTMEWIDTRIAERFNPPARKPVNNNQKSPAPRRKQGNFPHTQHMPNLKKKNRKQKKRANSGQNKRR